MSMLSSMNSALSSGLILQLWCAPKANTVEVTPSVTIAIAINFVDFFISYSSDKLIEVARLAGDDASCLSRR